MELRQLFGVHTQSKVPFNYEDMSDFSDADISTGLFTFYNFSCLFTYTYSITSLRAPSLSADLNLVRFIFWV